MLDPSVARALVPINSLTPAHYEELAPAVVIEKIPKGQTLFKQGATDNETLYVLKGEVALIPADSRDGRVIAGGTRAGSLPAGAVETPPVHRQEQDRDHARACPQRSARPPAYLGPGHRGV